MSDLLIRDEIAVQLPLISEAGFEETTGQQQAEMGDEHAVAQEVQDPVLQGLAILSMRFSNSGNSDRSCLPPPGFSGAADRYYELIGTMQATRLPGVSWFKY